MAQRWSITSFGRIGLCLWLLTVVLRGIAVLHLSRLDYLPLVLLGGVVILWMWAHYGGLHGGVALGGEVALLVLWSAWRREDILPSLLCWGAAAAWWGGVVLYLHAGGKRSRRRLQVLAGEKRQVDGKVASLGGELAKREARLGVSFRWLERLGGLVNLAEELLPAYKPEMLVRALKSHVAALCPPADRLFVYRGRDERLEVLAAVVPPDENGAISPDDVDRRVMQDMRPVLMDGPSSSPEGLTRDRPIGSMISAALTLRMAREVGGAVRQALGLLRVEAVEPGVYDATDLEILKVVADLSASVLHNAELYDRAEQLAVHDALTGLYLRQVFYERATQDLSRARREGSQVCLAIFDIDDFKNFNDTWGHAAGDLVLRRIAGVVQAEAVPGETACRYGGEELALLMHQDVSRAAKRVKKIVERAKAEHYTLPDDDGVLHEAAATVSAGLAAFPLHADELVSLIQQADRALYRAKRLGKKQLVIARSR